MKINEIVKVGQSEVTGKVIDFNMESALVEHYIIIDGENKLVKQWYKNEALKKIKVEKTSSKIVEENTVGFEKTLEFGVPNGSQPIKKTKKTKKL